MLKSAKEDADDGADAGDDGRLRRRNRVGGTLLGQRLAPRAGPRGLSNLDDFALAEELLAARHAVWVYSRRGRGGSGDGPDYGFEREVEAVLAVLDAAGDGAYLLGHSQGASYCLLAALRAPSLRSLALYEPPLHVDRRVDAALLDALESALDAGDPDRALELFLPVAGIVEQEVEAIRSEEQVWEALREGVVVLPRELRALVGDGGMLLSAADPPAVPTLYLYGEHTAAPVFPTLAEIAELMPEAQLHCLRGQRHMAIAFDPTTFAQALLAFTSAHDA